jgi:hypothetical protein
MKFIKDWGMLIKNVASFLLGTLKLHFIEKVYKRNQQDPRDEKG